jgi:cysteine-rich repeat protein
MCKQNNVCEQCAAGYVINGTSCAIEPCASSCACGGFYLPKVNGTCATLCGDGIKVGVEECDDNNTVDRDGCSSLCRI